MPQPRRRPTRHDPVRPRPVRRIVARLAVALGGGLLVLAGLVMLVTPGPGWLAIFAGLTLWGREFAWAHALTTWARRRAVRGLRRVRARRVARVRPGTVDPGL